MEKHGNDIMRCLNMQGVTLVELMVALAISSIISAAMYSAYTGLQRVNHDQELIVETQQNLRAGLDMMAREIRMAGYDPDKKWNAGFTAATATSVTFTINDVDDKDGDGLEDDGDGRDNDGDGQIDEIGELKTVSYDFNVGYGDTDGINDVRRRVDAGNWIVLIENVERVEFYYTLADGTQLPTLDTATGQLSTVPLTATQRSQIRSVQISVLARAPGISLNYRNNETYRSASGRVWGPFNDNVRRRMQILQVNCRNMGW
jgi:type IV pilus assembly protein PilW